MHSLLRFFFAKALTFEFVLHFVRCDSDTVTLSPNQIIINSDIYRLKHRVKNSTILWLKRGITERKTERKTQTKFETKFNQQKSNLPPSSFHAVSSGDRQTVAASFKK